MIEIIPAIDIIDGRCVRLSQGAYESKKIYDAPVTDMALRLSDCGVRRIHMVDLDGAKASSPVNLRTLEKVASKVSVEIEWGGGISSDSALRDIFNAGADCGIVGSIAVKDSALMKSWLLRHGPERIILGADVRNGKVAVKGWLEDSGKTIESLLTEFEGLTQAICTDISRDGMLEGPSFGLYGELQRNYPGICFTVSGGISGMSDIERLNGMGLRKVIVGKAIYENRIKLEEITRWQLQNA